ncbi:hypothetical protein GCM10023203_40090 [Actinomycetospora straminea]|uniref:Uncharacterized protein n=1 Tax=Actinomycetospora straminea TaxID=663607 RepID=A0ABP9EPH1_9PSEU
MSSAAWRLRDLAPVDEVVDEVGDGVDDGVGGAVGSGPESGDELRGAGAGSRGAARGSIRACSPVDVYRGERPVAPAVPPALGAPNDSAEAKLSSPARAGTSASRPPAGRVGPERTRKASVRSSGSRIGEDVAAGVWAVDVWAAGVWAAGVWAAGV